MHCETLNCSAMATVKMPLNDNENWEYACNSFCLSISHYEMTDKTSIRISCVFSCAPLAIWMWLWLWLCLCLCLSVSLYVMHMVFFFCCVSSFSSFPNARFCLSISEQKLYAVGIKHMYCSVLSLSLQWIQLVYCTEFVHMHNIRR